MNLAWPLCIFSLILLPIFASELDFLKILDDLISYRIVFKNYKDYEKLARPNEQGEWIVNKDENWVKIKSADSEEYNCLLPVILSNTKKRIESYIGPSPAELLEPLYKVSDCSYRMESYWNYEVCHGRYILQHHDEKETKHRKEYYLGNFVSAQAESKLIISERKTLDAYYDCYNFVDLETGTHRQEVKSILDVEAKKFDQLNPPKRKIGDDYQAYYPVTYVRGTTCDITNHPRTTIIIYVCKEGSKNFIQSINEISSCTYEIVVLTSHLCAHPSFQKAPIKEHEIQCFADSTKENAKPKSLISIENEDSNQFLKEFTTYSGVKDFLNSIFERVDSNAAESAQINVLLESIKLAKKELTSALNKVTIKDSQSASVLSPEYIQEFWEGKNCLKSGNGYWKFEVCFGKKILQFHDSPGKERRTILLGKFDKQAQIEWIEKNPHKGPKIEDNKIIQATYIFNQGDVCEETGKPRICELRIRCHRDFKNEVKNVFIYLMEPEMCSYVMVVESVLLCEELEKVDKNGFPPTMPKNEEDESNLEVPMEKKIIAKKISLNAIENLDNILENFKNSKDDNEEGGKEDTERENPGYQIKVERIQINDDVIKMVEKLSNLKWESEVIEDKSDDEEDYSQKKKF